MKTHAVLLNLTAIVDAVFFVLFLIFLWITFAH